MENIKQTLAKNLIILRKSVNLTQADLANRLNYSDKAISKWERGESAPDIEILYELSKIYNVKIDDMISGEIALKPTKNIKTIQHNLITIMSILLVWLITTVIYVLFVWKELPKPWLVFIYAIPVSSVVWIVFNSIWGRRFFNCVIVSILLWTSVLSLTLGIPSVNNLLFLIAIPTEIIIICWYGLIFLKHKEFKIKEFIEATFNKRKSKKKNNKSLIMIDNDTENSNSEKDINK